MASSERGGHALSPGRRQLAWSLFWIALATALTARFLPPWRVASFGFAIAAAASVRWALRNRSWFLGLAVVVTVLGLAAASVVHLELKGLRVVEPRLAPVLGALAVTLAAAFLTDAVARRRGLAARSLVAAALSTPLAYGITLLLAYTALSTVRVKVAIISLTVNDPLPRAFGIAHAVLSLKIAAPLMAGSIAALRAEQR